MNNPLEGRDAVATGTEPPVADRAADRALRVPGVAALHGGQFGEVATYLPGRRLLGVRITDTGCAVHVVVGYGHDVRRVAAEVHRSVQPLVTVPVTVTVEDVADPADDAADRTTADPTGPGEPVHADRREGTPR